MKMILFCTEHGSENYEVFEWLNENDQLCAECAICEAETILMDYSEAYYSPNQKVRDGLKWKPNDHL